MSLANFERYVDRIVPVMLLGIGMFTAFATAGLGV